MGVGLFFGSSQLFVNQATMSAALVATILPPTNGITFARSIDALTGGTIALVVAAVLLPTDPIRLLREAVKPVLEELAAVLRDVAAALRAKSMEDAEAALERARAVDSLGDSFSSAVRESRETARYSPARRGDRGEVEVYGDAAARIDLAVRNVRVLCRGVTRAISLHDNIPEDVPGAIEDLALAVTSLEGALEDEASTERAREPAIRAAVTATMALERTGNLSVSVIVGQIRSTAVDLLAGSGLSNDEAIAAVRGAVRRAQT
jgi:uncharacterized membrane protein YgaE (UPF0421/DUF939 family)